MANLRWPIVNVLLRWLDIAVYLVFLAFALYFGPHTSAWYVGLALAAVTVPFWFVARLQLGAAFSVRAQAHELVTTGIYAKIRHPVYVFGGLAWLGSLLALLGWGALAIGLVIAAVEFARARREERVLTTTFGPEYEAYRSKTWF
jgi:protein-S-isoprenylcysteine O-methyltransferase Ste14